MKLKVNKSESYNWSIVVDEKELRRLDEIIKKAFNDSNEDAKLGYEIKCSDGSLIETDNIDEVVSEESSKNHQIQSIKVNAINPRVSKQIDISFGYKGLFEKPVNYSIRGDSRDWVYLTASKIEERIKNLKEWYSIIPAMSDSLWILLITPLWFGIYLYLKYSTRTFVSTEIIFIYILAIGFLYLFNKLIVKGHHFLFPSVVFKIGDGIKRYDDLVKLRGQIFWGVIVSLIVSIIASLIIIYGTSFFL